MSMEDYEAKRAQDLATRKALWEQLANVAQAMQEYFPGWTITDDAEENEWGLNISIAHPDGRVISLHTSDGYQRKGTFAVSGNYPKDEAKGGSYSSPRDWGAIGYNESAPSINVSTSRSAKAIAQDIIRRFLPVYTAIYEKCVKAKQERTEYRDSRRVEMEKIAKTLGEDMRGEPDNLSVHFTSETGYGSFDAYKIELRSLPLSVVLEIAKVIAKAMQKGALDEKKGDR